MIRSVVLSAVVLFSGAAFAKETASTLKIAGWKTQGCVDYTVDTLKQTPGVVSASGELGKMELVVKFDDAKADLTKLEAAVVKSGFKLAKADAKAAEKPAEKKK